MRHTLVLGMVAAAIGAFASLIPAGCTEVRRGLGEACIGDNDCVSGLCTAQVCVAPPAGLDATVRTDAGLDAEGDTGLDATVGGDAGLDGADAAITDGAGDGGARTDSRMPEDGNLGDHRG